MSAHAGQNVVEDGLVFCIDPTDPKSYIGSGATLYDRIEGKLTETISSSRWVVDSIIPILNMRIVQSSNTIQNSEKFYFIKTTELPKEVESCVINIWNYILNNNDV